MPLYLQDVDLYHFLVNVIDYPVMGGNVSEEETIDLDELEDMFPDDFCGV